MNNQLYAFSVVTGELFTIEQEDIKLLFPFQIPLKQKPPIRCKRCYGRGYVDVSSKTKLYNMCPCMSKCLADGYTPSKLSIELPRYQ